MMIKQPFKPHSHTHASNFRLRDAINKPVDLLEYALELGLKGIAITDHETLSSHVKAFRHVQDNQDRFKDFTLAFGNEIYLVDKEDTLSKKELNEKIVFPHFILIAKNQHGYEGLKKLSSRAWENSFFYRGMERVPTYKDELEEIMKDYKGDIIATSACVGGELPQALINYKRNPSKETKSKVHQLVVWLKKVFGDDLYFELQPSHNQDQLDANEGLLKIGEAYGVHCVVSTDAHYLNKEQARAHEVYLQASNGEREVAAFYATTYLMDRDQLLEYFDETILDKLIENTHLISDSIEPIEFKMETQVPKAHIPEYKMNNLL